MKKYFRGLILRLFGLMGSSLVPSEVPWAPCPTQATHVSSTLLRFASHSDVNVSSKEIQGVTCHTPN